MIEFSEWLEEEMRVRGLTQADLARMSGISKPQISRILNMRNSPGTETLQKLAAALDLPESVLYQQAGQLNDGPFESPKLAELTALGSQLNADELQILINMARAYVRGLHDPAKEDR